MPLYIQAKNKSLGPNQVMDKETLLWIKENSSNILMTSNAGILKIQDITTICEFSPHQDWFARPEHLNSIHGISHVLRVVINSLVICKKLNVRNTLPYLLAASAHDIRRHNDNADIGHGKRASEWLEQNKEYVRGIFQMNVEDIELAQILVSYHETEYEDIPENVLKVYQKEISILKAADALDRFRLPKEKWWPNPDRLKNIDITPYIYSCRLNTLLSEEDIINGSEINTAVIKNTIKTFC